MLVRGWRLVWLLVWMLGGVAWAQKPGAPPSKPTPEIQKLIDAATGDQVEWRDAVPLLEKALARARKIHDRAGEGRCLFWLGRSWRELSQPEKALDFYQQALAIFREVKDRAGEAKVLSNIGAVYHDLGQLEKALNFYRQALPILRETKDRMGEGTALNNIGFVYQALGQPEKALDSYQQALAIFREVKDRAEEGTALSNLGFVYQALGQPERALGFYLKALPIARAVKDRAAEGTTLGSIGALYQALGQPEKALDFYQQALVIWREVKDRQGEGTTLSNIGALYQALGQPEKALDFYQQALAIAREAKDRSGEATALNNIGAAYRDLSQLNKALDFYQQSLAIAREVKNRGGEGTVLGNLGFVYQALGQPEKALEFYQQALAIAREVKDRAEEGRALGYLGLVYEDLGQPERALDFFQQALPILREVKDRAGEGTTLNNLGLVYQDLGQPEKSLDFYQQSLAIARELKGRTGEGTALNNIGFVSRDLGQPEKALDCYRQALAIARETKDRRGEGTTLNNAAAVVASTQPRAAAWLGSMGIARATRTRKDSQIDASAERSLAEKLMAPYGRQAELLLAQGRLPEAEEMVRLQASSAVKDQAVPQSSLEAGWTARYEAFMTTYAPLAQAATSLAVKKSRTPAEEKELADLTARRAALEGEFKALLAAIFAEAKAADPAKDRVAETPASREADAALERLGPTARIVYAFPQFGQGKEKGDDQVHLLVISSHARQVKTIPAKDLDGTLKAFLSAVSNPRVDPRPAGEKLYELLVGPIEADLDPEGVTMWRLEGHLADVPLGALWDGKAFLVQRRRFARFAPDAIAALAKDPLPLGGGVALFGTSEARKAVEPLTGLPLSFSELPGVGFETAKVGSLWGVKPELDASFTPATLERGIASKPRVLYLATHFRAYPGDDRRAFVLTGTGAPWSVETLKGLAPDALSSVELAVLSACATAVGRTSTGTNMESLGAWLERKGARAVLSTLWPLDDCGAAVLVPEFCRIWKAHPEGTKLDALRAAQMAMIAGTLTPTSVGYHRGATDVSPTSATDAPPWPSTLPPFGHPYYWAPFILTGNWK